LTTLPDEKREHVWSKIVRKRKEKSSTNNSKLAERLGGRGAKGKKKGEKWLRCGLKKIRGEGWEKRTQRNLY